MILFNFWITSNAVELLFGGILFYTTKSGRHDISFYAVPAGSLSRCFSVFFCPPEPVMNVAGMTTVFSVFVAIGNERAATVSAGQMVIGAFLSYDILRMCRPPFPSALFRTEFPTPSRFRLDYLPAAIRTKSDSCCVNSFHRIAPFPTENGRKYSVFCCPIVRSLYKSLHYSPPHETSVPSRKTTFSTPSSYTTMWLSVASITSRFGISFSLTPANNS